MTAKRQQEIYLQKISDKKDLKEKYLNRANEEPAESNITNRSFRRLIQQNYDTISDNESIKRFFKNIFNLLSAANICFSSGTFIFEESNNCLFNYLTYGKLTLDSNTYKCEDPENGVITRNSQFTRIMLPNTRAFGTKTHKKIYDKIPSCGNAIYPCYSPDVCIPETGFGVSFDKSIINTKFQKIFDPPIEGICDTCINPGRTAPYTTSETKRLCLYYPFKVQTNNFPNFPSPPRETGNYEHSFLFVKFEAEPVSEEFMSIDNAKHMGNFAKAFIGSKENYDNGIDTDRKLYIRREDKNEADNPDTNWRGARNKKQCDYNVYNKDLDISFYKVIFGVSNNYIEKIEWYDQNLRTGCEFFVTKELLEYFFIHFFNTEILDCGHLEELLEDLLFDTETTNESDSLMHNHFWDAHSSADDRFWDAPTNTHPWDAPTNTYPWDAPTNAGSRKIKLLKIKKTRRNKRKTRRNKRKTKRNKRKTKRN
jgi:hypothetical protein